MNEYLVELALAGGVSVLAYLLQKKDADQAKLIDDLYTKHGEDAARLHEVELKLATDHYSKRELDTKFDRLDASLARGFDGLTAKLDALNAAVVAHISAENHTK